MTTLDQRFSKLLKTQKGHYLQGELVDFGAIDCALKELEQYDLSTLVSDRQKKAFWVNVYNGLTNYWMIRKRIRRSMKEDLRIFVYNQVKIGGFKFSLDQIEHGILRRNAKVKYWPLPQFMPWDRRRAFICAQLDYRIHFALNCGANSCPAIAFYDPENIENQLAQAEAIFAETEFIVDEELCTLTVSKIFQWYQKDFKNIYLNDPKYAAFEVISKPYDWQVR